MPTPFVPLSTGVYQPTSAFHAIPLHTAVCHAQTGALIALTGPAHDPTSHAYATLFAASSNFLLEAVRQGRVACRLLAEKHMEAGDFESGGYWMKKANACGDAIAAATGQWEV